MAAGLAFFALLFAGLLLSQSFSPVMTADRPDAKKPSNLDLPEQDEGLGDSPSPSPLPDDVGATAANFRGLATWTFNSSHFVFEDPPSDFYKSFTLLDSWTSIRKWASELFEFSSNFATKKPRPSKFPANECTPERPCGVTFTKNRKPDRRGEDVEKGMAVNNCGKQGDWQFTEFEFKHIIRTTEEFWEPSKFPIHSWSASHWRRSDSPYLQSTFFYVPKLEVIDYSLVDDGGSPMCKAHNYYDTWTCVKTGLSEDTYSGCYHSGQCRPTYRKVDGHLLPMECLAGSAEPAKDFVPELYHFVNLQDIFVDGAGIKLPALQWLRDLAAWESRKATRTGAGLQFREPKPTPYKTKREQLLEAFNDWLIRHPDLKIPPRVKRLFFRQPYFVFKKNMRKPTAPKEGYIPFQELEIEKNPMYLPSPDATGIEVPFPWSGTPKVQATVEDGPEWNLDDMARPNEPTAATEQKPPAGEEVDGQGVLTKEETWEDMASNLESLRGKKPQ